MGLAWWLSGKESTRQGRRHRFNSWYGKMPHAAEQPNPVGSNYWACSLESGSRNYWSLHVLQSHRLHNTRRHRTSGEEPLLTAPIEKPEQWWRPITAKTKIYLKKKKKQTNSLMGEQGDPYPKPAAIYCWVGPLYAGSRNKHGPLHPQELSLVRGWDGWLASPTQWTWVWANSERRWRTGEAGVFRAMGVQRVGHWAAEHQPQGS